MINFLKMAKSPRIGPRNAKQISYALQKLGREILLSPTPWYGPIVLRPNHADLIAFEQVFRYLCYGELEKMQPIRTVIDAGANIGLSAIYFSKRLNATEIIGLEPEKGNYNQAIKNTQALSTVKLLNAALWYEPSTVRISNLDTGGGLGFQVEESRSSDDPVPAMTVTQIMHDRGWRYLDLLKIDIEGAELELFSHPSRREWINRIKVIVVELHDWIRPGCSSAFFKAMADIEEIEMTISGENLIIVNKQVAAILSQ
jgi:FkbM family methyltransferase